MRDFNKQPGVTGMHFEKHEVVHRVCALHRARHEDHDKLIQVLVEAQQIGKDNGEINHNCVYRLGLFLPALRDLLLSVVFFF